MAIVNGFTTLAAVKLEAGISDTSQDALLEALISSASSAIQVFLGREIVKTTYTDEPYSINDCQLLYLKEYPIQSITSLKLQGVTQTENVDFFLSSEDAKAGRVYRAAGWIGRKYSRGTFPDAFAGARDIIVTYVAGWLLPADVGYSAGGATSLPLALSYACTRAVVSRFRTVQSQSDGLKQLSEGGLSYTWFGPESYLQGSGGFDSIVMSMLLPFKRMAVA